MDESVLGWCACDQVIDIVLEQNELAPPDLSALTEMISTRASVGEIDRERRGCVDR